MLERVQHGDGCVAYRSPVLLEAGVPHAFTTRIGPGGMELDVDDLDACAALLGRLARGLDRRPAGAKQVHGAKVLEVGAGTPAEANGFDALVTGSAERLVVVRTADCVPVLLASADGRRVAAVHAGWRGLVAGVIRSAIAALDAGELVAAIGPCLSHERFEIGDEVAAQFDRAGLATTVERRPGRRPHADLRAAAAIQLERAGVTRIDTTDRCTWEHADDFWSYRRDVTHGPALRTGRLAALIGTAGGTARARDRHSRREA